MLLANIGAMSPTIRIDNEVFDALKRHAEPLVDTPNSVLRKVLGLAPRSAEAEQPAPAEQLRPGRKRRPSKQRGTQSRRKKQSQRAQAGALLPDSKYEIPILEILRENGGRAPTREVIDALGERLDGDLTVVDREPLSSGQIRWRNRAQFVRLNLIDRGDMTKGSPRGVWEITEQGLHRIGPER
jgi:hypothetical protein